jgi:hypothetical protein
LGTQDKLKLQATISQFDDDNSNNEAIGKQIWEMTEIAK